MKYLPLLIMLFLAAGGYFWYEQSSLPGRAETQPGAEFAPAEPVRTEQTYTVAEGDTFTSVLENLNFDYQQALDIVEAAAETFDFTNVRLDKTFRVVSVDGQRQTLEYEPNKEDLVVVDLTADGYQTEVVPIPYDVTIERAEVTIDESMFLSGLNAGLSEVLILDLAETLAWEIDFATQVQTGDSFVVVYEKRTRAGQDAGVGRIHAASFTNVGQTSYAYRYTNTNEETGYYDAAGSSLIRPFLKAPLSYNRISSGFTYARFDPITSVLGTHRAIDYAAPLGTPVLAVGHGTITSLGWNGPYGNFIDIHHNDTYQTQYAHLSAYAKGLRVGSEVEQGQVIGYVGSTGHSTGPHLHYQVKVHGELVNPLEIEFPKGESLSEEELPDFLNKKTELDTLLNP
ncbi:peptidoglycan DD-metalloendopeptidase family protein [Patescibacteria group bacterium]|nr:peptidoglycan DD-metalloendopeptidase family protein [Patescibacteria group bacterium]MBU1705174.1 peptidoglycan DD-metalloendopeptidase family protein [Patescibacteria group bacterium]